LMGVESHAMLLAAETEDGLTVLSFDKDAKVGVRIR
jgi:tRNA-binding EMAP/Myf-like protein